MCAAFAAAGAMPSMTGQTCLSSMAANPGSPPTGWTGTLVCVGKCSDIDPCAQNSRPATHGGQAGQETYCSCSSAPPGGEEGLEPTCVMMWFVPAGGAGRIICSQESGCTNNAHTCALRDATNEVRIDEPAPPNMKYYYCTCQ